MMPTFRLDSLIATIDTIGSNAIVLSKAAEAYQPKAYPRPKAPVTDALRAQGREALCQLMAEEPRLAAAVRGTADLAHRLTPWAEAQLYDAVVSRHVPGFNFCTPLWMPMHLLLAQMTTDAKRVTALMDLATCTEHLLEIPGASAPWTREDVTAAYELVRRHQGEKWALPEAKIALDTVSDRGKADGIGGFRALIVEQAVVECFSTEAFVLDLAKNVGQLDTALDQLLTEGLDPYIPNQEDM